MSLGQYPQNTVAAEISKYMGNAVSLSSIWGKLIYNVKASPYLAKGDGVTDDTAAIQAAITAANGVSPVYFPPGTYKITSSLINLSGKSLSLIGAGSTANPLNGHDAPYTPQTKIIWAGTSGDMVKILGPIGGCRIEGITFDGAGLATNGITLDTVQFSKFYDISVNSVTASGIWCNTNQAAGLYPTDNSVNTMFNDFAKITMASVPKGFLLDGNTISLSNTCHNTFSQIKIDYTGTIAFHFNKSDNNTVTELYTSGTGYAVQIEATSGAEYIYHLQGRANGISGNSGLFIFGYDRSNGQAEPTGSNISWFETGMNSTRSVLQKPILLPTNDNSLTLQGRTVSFPFSTTANLPVNTTTTLNISGAPSGITNAVMPIQFTPIGMSISLSSFITAGSFTVQVLSNSTVIWSEVIIYPSGNNQFFQFSQSYDSASGKVNAGSSLVVQIVTNASYAPTTIQAYVNIIGVI
jgi:hypothetical protein